MTHQDGQTPAGDLVIGAGAASPENARADRPATRKAGRAVREIVETLVLAALIFFAVRMVVLNFRVDGNSMVPNLQNEQMLLVNRNAYRSFDLSPIANLLPGEDPEETDEFYPFDPPERGDIIVFEPPTNSDKPYIKRIIGLPGEEVSFRDGKVLVNGTELDEEYIDKPTRCQSGEMCDLVVPEDSVFVLGDNRNNSSDSRSFGPVSLDRVVGKAWLSYWPPSDIGFVPHYEYDGISERSVARGETPAVSAAEASPRPDRVERERPRREREERSRGEKQPEVEVTASAAP